MAVSDPMQPQQPMRQGLMAGAAPPPNPTAPGADPDTETFETMVAGLLEYIYGKGEKGIRKQLKDAKNLPQTVGLAAFHLVKSAADQATQAGHEFDLDMVMGVATEVIDSLFKMAAALKLKVGDPEQANAEALFTAVQAYQQTAKPGSEEQESAKAMLAQMQQEGMVDEGAATLQELGAKAGVDPFADANAAQAPPQTPMAQGVRAGLMGMGG